MATRRLKAHPQATAQEQGGLRPPLQLVAAQVFAANERMHQMLIGHLAPEAWDHQERSLLYEVQVVPE